MSQNQQTRLDGIESSRQDKTDSEILPPFQDSDGRLDFARGDPENPLNWSNKRKCYITGVAILLVMNATFASSAPTGAFQGIINELDISNEEVGLVTTLFLLGFCTGPLVWAPLSEYYGRRWIFYIAFSFYLSFTFLCSFTPNFAGLLVGRFLTGIFAASALSNAPGVLADIWNPVARGNAMILFIVATFAGPALGPVVAGFLELTKTWRWTFYVLLLLAGVTEILLPTVPETLHGTILRKKAQRLRGLGPENGQKLPVTDSEQRGLLSLFKITLMRPWRILIDPISFLIAIFYSVVYTLLYMLFDIYPIVFQQQRDWNAGLGELPLIGVVIGACIGGIILYLISIKHKHKVKTGNSITPEDRLPAAMIGSILFPITMFWFAWTAEFSQIHWIVPTIAGTFLATSILLIFVGLINYLVDVYAAYAASAVAANTIIRSACGAAGPLFTQHMFDALGVGGGGSLIGGIAVLLAPVPFIFYRYGRFIRLRSKFAMKAANKVEVKTAD